MNREPRLSPAEFEVMEIIWRKGHATPKEIRAALRPERPLAPTTIYTLLSRMERRGFVRIVGDSSPYEYHPLVERDRVVRHLLADFVDRVLGGDSRPLAARIIEMGGLTPEQVRVMEEIIASGTRRK